ncbi:beta-amyrin 11-oxidase-like [Gossypium arboreum]|uniref:beta-amyrin 11-oxidase-like n=1 Tax=Gossypium arboreum TaxID=29729 RepID=UPI0022F15DA1|nr:beta-amyrin 11-oxidase-like [Gossypium arboreum]
MVLVFLWLIVAVIVGTFVLSFGFLKKPTGRDRNLQNLILQTQRYGETGIYKTNLFRNPSIIVCSPELCRKVLTDDEQFQLGYPLSSLVLDGMPSDYISGSGHKRFHRLTTSSLTRNEPLSLHIGSVEEIVTNALEECSKMKEPILFFHEMNKIAFKVIMTMFLGYATDDTVIASMEKSYTDLFSGLFCTPINIPGFAYHKAVKARKKLVKEIQGVLGEKRERKRNDPNSKIGLIDVIREAEDSKGEKLDEEYIIIILVMFLIAGRETSGRAATWATMYLHHHPHVLQKAKEEQEKIMKRRPSSQKGLTLSEIKQMKYLSKVIDETLRRRTNVFALFREAKNDTHLNGYFIPKGWKVLVWQNAVHMDPEIYPNPKEFLPSRWDGFKPKVGAFLPFGAGSSTCPGADLAKLVISIFLHCFILNYKWVYLKKFLIKLCFSSLYCIQFGNLVFNLVLQCYNQN